MEINGKDVPVQTGQVFDCDGSQLIVGERAETGMNGEEMWRTSTGGKGCTNIEACFVLYHWKLVGSPGYEPPAFTAGGDLSGDYPDRCQKVVEIPKPALVAPLDIVAACDAARGAFVNMTSGPGVTLPGRKSWGPRY